VRGQRFTEAERISNEHFLIVSSLLATRLFGDADPIGQHVKPGPNDPWSTVVGVAANVKNKSLTAMMNRSSIVCAEASRKIGRRGTRSS